MSFPPFSTQFTREYYEELTKQIPSAHISQRSAYEEIEIVEGCTLYDIYRQPRKPVTDPDATKVLHVRDLNSNLTCPICLGLINQTMVVMECLHRFCGDCIQKCLRLAIKECPSCRIHIPSKRALRRDLNFDALIATIYPDRQEFEQQEAQLIEEVNRLRNYNNAFTNGVKQGVESQASIRRQRGKKNTKSTIRRSSSSSQSQELINIGSGSKVEESAQESKSSQSTPLNEDRTSSAKKRKYPEMDAQEINLKVVLHPKETDLTKRVKKTLFRTSPRLKIRHLKRYLLGLMEVSKNSALASQIRITLPKENAEICGLHAGPQVDGLNNQNPSDTSQSDKHLRNDLFIEQHLADHVMLSEIYAQYGMGMDWEMKLCYHFSPDVIVGAQDMLQTIDVTVSRPSLGAEDVLGFGDKQIF